MKLKKAWYTITQVAEKWGCTEDDVLHQIQTHKLLIAFFLPETKFRVMRHPPGLGLCDENGNLLDPDGYNNFYDNFFKNEPVETYSGLFFPLSFNVDDYGIFSTKTEWVGNSSFPLVLSERDRHDIRRKPALFYLAESVPMTPASIIITASELQRFEAAHSPSATPGAGSEAVDPIADYLKTHKDAPDGEKGAWLQDNMKMTLNQIADELNIPGAVLNYNGGKSKSRKNTMGKIIRDWKDLQCKNIAPEV